MTSVTARRRKPVQLSGVISRPKGPLYALAVSLRADLAQRQAQLYDLSYGLHRQQGATYKANNVKLAHAGEQLRPAQDELAALRGVPAEADRPAPVPAAPTR